MVNRIIAENAITTGVATKDYWDVPHSNQIEGFTTDFSVNAGSTVDFKINVNGGAGSDYQVEVFRLGYYGGAGAREVASWTNTNATVQPDALYDATRGMVDAGNWSVTDSWTIPTDAVSGVYLARVQRLDAAGNPIPGAVNQIPFVVRNDGVAADIVLQTSDTTWQAYNGWFGNNGQVGANLYGDASGTVNHPDIPGASPYAPDRAYAVSYNRPFITRDGTSPLSGAQDYLFGADYSAIYWLEKQGYDVSYISGIDTDRLGPNYLTNYKAFISVGHDEYWSGGQRDNVEAARDAGVNLLFWSGNEVYWKTRWETSISADGTPYRTLVCYKETTAVANPNAGPADYYNLDPSNEWTGTWRDTRFHGNPLAGGGNPQDVDPISGLNPNCNCGENQLTGTIFGPDGTGEFGGGLDVPAQFAGLRVWRNTPVANGGQLDIAPGIIGYEWDTSPDDILRPQGLIKLSETTLSWSAILVDQGNTTQPGTATHNLTLYRAESGALVFGAGTVFWSWALSNQHDSSPYGAQIANTALQQFTVNMFADMGIQPGVADAVLASQGLVRAAGITDLVAATALIDDLPAMITALSPVMITGTATDDDGNPLTADGKVAVVEVSLDNGLSWRVAKTTDAWATWSYTWTPTQLGNYTILARAIDDSLNVVTAVKDSEALAVTTPDVFSMFGGVTPSGVLVNDGQTVEVGMRFSVDRVGEITQLKYWRAAGDASDTDVRDGHLWASDGTLLATVTFTSAPGDSGWQVAALSTPVSLAANATYVVSFRTADNYFSTTGFFDPSRDVSYDGIDDNAFGGPFGVIRAPESGNGGGNGVYVYGGGAPRFPNLSYQGENYWVDVTFNPADTSNNQLPVFTSGTAFSRSENQTAVGMVTATDPDGNALTYGIAGGADAGRFWINATTGLLSFLTAPDYETPTDSDGNNIYDLTISVSDGVAAPVTQAIQVSVTDIAEAGTTYRLYGAGDAPAQIKTDDSTDYELGTKFQANTSGWITDLRYFRGLADASDTDVRTLNLWSITGVRLAQATVTSTAGATGWQVAALTTPVAIQANTTYIVSYGTTQNYAFSQSYFTTAHTGPNGVLTALASGASGGNGVFAAGSPGSFPTGSFNASNYWVDVTFTQTLGSPPAFTSPAAFVADENQTAVATVTASDADGDSLSFAISGGADAARFAINAATGALSFLAAPDFEAPTDSNGDNIYQVSVRVTDSTGAQATQTIAVTVNDVVETPPNQAPVITSAASVNAAENQAIAADVQATDANGDTLTYAIVAGADAALFTIDSATGVLSFIAAPNFEAPADGDADNAYQVLVSVSDGIAPPVTQALTITVTNVNEAPVLAPSAAISVAENQTAVTTVIGTDPDGTALTYSISGGADASRFTINATTGVLAFVSAPDYEAPADANLDNVYQVIVSASDGSPTAASQTVSVTVTDLDETPANLPPAFTSPAAVTADENQTVAAALTATDPDADTLTYAIVGGVDAALFTINSATGVVSFVSAPDFEAPGDAGANNVYNLTVSVSDGKAPAVTQSLAITVTNVNDAPVITSSAAVTVAENQSAALTVTATDAENSTLTYGIAGGADATRFTIDSVTGALSFINAPDFEAPADADNDNVYQVIVSANDGQVQVSQQVAITVSDVNEVPPNSAPVIVTTALSAPEEQTAAGRVVATDADVDTLTYSITGGIDRNLFDIDSATGDLVFLAAPNFEAPGDSGGDNVYDLVVTVSDGITPAVSQAITVSVGNVDETPTITSPASFSAAEIQKAVGFVTGADPDSGAILTYALAGGADVSLFSIDAGTGALSFVNAPDFEAPSDSDLDNIYQVTVSVSDGVHMAVTQAISVQVTDLPDTTVNQVPSFTSPTALSVAENQTLATTLTATDADGDPLTYAITGGNDQGRFTINATTGAISFTSAANFEAPADLDGNNVYDLVVSVTDGKSAAVTQTLAIAVTDVNEAPTIASITAPATDEDAAPVQIDLLAGATDPEGTAVSLTGPVTVTSSNAARTVTYTLTGGVLTLDPAQFGSMVLGQSETVTIAYQISDGSNPVANTATIVIAGRDDATPGQVINGNSSANTLTGGAGDDTISGLGGNDVLNGGAGNDTLNGGTGTDTVNGDAGNDIILIRSTEAQNDTMNGGADIDTLRLTGTAAVVLTGTSQLTGIEVLEGGGLSLSGTSAANVFNLSGFTSVTGLASLLGLAGNDTLTGSAFADTINGGTGTDVIDAGGGDDVVLIASSEATTDTMAGGSGNDTLRLTGTAAVALTGTSQLTGFEVLDGGGLSLTGTTGNNVIDLSIFTTITGLGVVDGLAGNDTITGSAFADTINGGSGIDVIDAGGGDDVVLISGSDAASDTLAGGSGNDTLRLTGTATVVINSMALVSGFEILDGAGRTLAGSANADVINLSSFASVLNLAELQGLNGNDTLTGTSGNDRINGGAGTDTIIAGDGDDTIVISSNQGSTDIVDGGAGVDRVLVLAAGGNVTLTNTTRMSNIESFDGAGVAIVGSSASDTLDFRAIGNLVNVASIQGGVGNDVIAGGTGNDTMTGGSGADAFIFAFGLTTGDDVITDFDASGNDVIRLIGYAPGSNLAAATTFDAQGALIDLDVLGGDGSIRLTGVTSLNYTTEDFLFT